MNIKTITDRAIIEPEELKQIADQGITVRLVDASYALPGSGENPHNRFLQERIGAAVFFDIDAIADTLSALPHMLPSPQSFETSASQLGITRDDLVVIYGQSGMVMGPARAWWTFRVFGHTNVCILNGGLPAWKAAGYEINTAPAELPPPAVYKAEFQPALVCNLQDVRESSQNGQAQIFDARPAARFSGQAPEPREGLRRGHIPGSRNIPATVLVDAQTGKLKSPDDIQAILEDADFQPGKPVITTCGSGVTACVIALALFHLGHKEAIVYDGSWSEWGIEDADTRVASL